MPRCKVRSTWLCRCWKMCGAAVFAAMCSRPGRVTAWGVGGDLRMSRDQQPKARHERGGILVTV